MNEEVEEIPVFERDESGTTTFYDEEGNATATLKVSSTMSAAFALGGGIRYPQGLYDGDTIDVDNGVARGIDGSERIIHVDIGNYHHHFFVNPRKFQHPKYLARSLKKLLAEQTRVSARWQSVFKEIQEAGRVHHQNEWGNWEALIVTDHGYGDGISSKLLQQKPRKLLHADIGEKYARVNRRMRWINTIISYVMNKLKGILIYQGWLPEPMDSFGPKYLQLTIEDTRWLFFQGGYGPWTLLVEPTHNVVEMEL